MTYLEQYKELLLEKLLRLYSEQENAVIRCGIYEAREIVYKSKPSKDWILEPLKGGDA